jgi:hypothetical protein
MPQPDFPVDSVMGWIYHLKDEEVFLDVLPQNALGGHIGAILDYHCK